MQLEELPSWKVPSWGALSWKDRFQVGKPEMKPERHVAAGKTTRSYKNIDLVGKIRLGVELSTKSLILIPYANP